MDSYNNQQTLFKLYSIHDNAHNRSSIKYYLDIRESLIILFKQLASLTNEELIEKEIIERMPGILNRFITINNEDKKYE